LVDPDQPYERGFRQPGERAAKLRADPARWTRVRLVGCGRKLGGSGASGLRMLERAGGSTHDVTSGTTRVGAISRHASANRFCSSGKSQVLAPARAMSRRSQAGGTKCCCKRKSSRSRRLARLRCTAAPTAAVDAITQTRDVETEAAKVGTIPAGAGSRGFHQTVKARQSMRRPFSRTARISLWRLRCCSGRNRMAVATDAKQLDARGRGSGRHNQTTVRRLRPLRRRALMTFWPPAVAIRAR